MARKGRKHDRDHVRKALTPKQKALRELGMVMATYRQPRDTVLIQKFAEKEKGALGDE